MNQARHAKLRAAGWYYDPLSERYSAPNTPLDGTQTMYAQAEAWEKHEAAQNRTKPATKAADDQGGRHGTAG